MKFFAPILAALALTGCSLFLAPAPVAPEQPEAEASYARIDFADQVATPAERATCEAAGGEVSRMGLLGWEHCLQTYPDAGKVCSDAADCLGTCRNTENHPPQTKATGTCQVADAPFGCYAMIEGGTVGHTLCVD